MTVSVADVQRSSHSEQIDSMSPQLEDAPNTSGQRTTLSLGRSRKMHPRHIAGIREG